MKVILTQEVKGRGGEGDVVEVARGFAVNYLFPRKMAIQATPGNLKQLELRSHNIRKREDERIGEAQAVANKLEGASVTIEAKAGEEGRLFGSVTAHMIEAAIGEQLDVDIDRRKMDIHGHIKEVGEHPVTVQVYRDVKAEVIVKVVAEGGEIIHEPTTAEEIVAQVEAEEEAAVEETVEETADEVVVVAGDDTAEEEEAAE